MKTFLITAIAALTVSSSAFAMCGPQVNLSASENSNHTLGTNDSVGVQDFGDSFNFSTNNNDTAGVNLSLTISFNLDGGRGCRELDARIAESRDRNLRANRQALVNEQNALAAAVDATIKVVTFCETADLEIPAIAELCHGHTK